ncbi:MAG: TIGR00725 family protein [bacterium]|nr:TIGR00725 family protein [bacterium]
MREVQISVIGAGQATQQQEHLAYKLGSAIAHQRWVLVSGGMGGVMEAAARGAVEAGGTAVGILPTYNKHDGNVHNTISIPTGMGHARNTIVAASGDAVIAVGGSYGTISEIALALKLGKPVAALDSPLEIEGIYRPSDIEDAISYVREQLKL